MPARGDQFLLALTVGLLAFLLIDTLREGLEAGAEPGAPQDGNACLGLHGSRHRVLMASDAARHAAEGVALASFIALGIGLHNFGEGLAVGASLAAGAAALATFLVIGFTIHNVTEGIGIAVPLVEARPKLIVFVGLVLLAGLPAVAGVWLGALAVRPLWLALAFGVAAGALLQVIIEVVGLTARSSGRASARSTPAASPQGLVVMYSTALLV